MNRWSLIAVLLGLLLVAAPFTKQQFARAEEEYEEDEDDEGEPAAAADESEKDVVVLTTKNFDTIVSGSKFALVEFYAPWCGHCKTLKPHYAKAATELKAYNPDIVIGKVDATVESELGTKYEVKGYPTLKWFVDGELHSDYNGGREADGIVSWIKKKTGPVTTPVETVDALKEAESAPVLVVGYFEKPEGDAYEAFKAVAKKTEDVIFAETSSADVAKAAGISKKGGVAAIKNFPGEEREVVEMSGDVDAENVQAFVTAEKLPLTIEFNQANSEKIFGSGIPKQLILYSSAAGLEAGADVITTFKEVAKKFKGKLVFVTVNSEGESAEPVANFFGLKEATPPVLIGFYMEGNKKYRLTEDLTVANAEKFAEGVLDGSIQPEYKSAPIPEEPYDSDVYTVVGKAVDSVVLDKTKDVLLEVYAPWCGHCKKLEPIYKKLGKRFRKVDSVIIAKMDGTENEHPAIEVKGFPTIMFFPAGEDKTAITFEGGDRTLKALTKFIKQHATIPYELPKKGEDEGSTPAEDENKIKDEL